MSTLLFKNNLDGTTDVVSGGINTLKINADKTLATATPSNTMSGNNLATVGQIPSLVVTSISGLLTADTSKVVNVLNYHIGLEGGGGVFYWDATKAKSEHNGGTVIDPTKVFPADWNNQTQLTTWFDAGNSGTGCWVRQYDGAVNVKWFGAKGDGVSDDQKPLQRTLDVSQQVFLPPTAVSYYLSDSVSPRSNTTIYGKGQSTHIQLKDGSVNGFYLDAVSGVTICELKISTSSQSNVTAYKAGILLANECRNCLIDAVSMFNMSYWGVVILESSNCTVRNCRFASWFGTIQDSAQIAIWKTSNSNLIEGNYCYASSEHGIFIQDPYTNSTPTGNSIVNNVVIGARYAGIIVYVTGAYNTQTLISGNHIRDISGTALGGLSGHGIYIQSAGGTIVTNNTISNCCISTTQFETQVVAAIGVSTGDLEVYPTGTIHEVIVSNNNITANRGPAIAVQTCSVPVIVESNVIISTGTDAVRGEAIYSVNANGLQIKNNVISHINPNYVAVQVMASSKPLTGISIVGNRIKEGSSGMLVQAVGGGSLTSSVITGNSLLGVSGIGFNLLGLSRVCLSNNNVSSSYIAYVQNSCTQVKLTSNSFYSNYGGYSIIFTGSIGSNAGTVADESNTFDATILNDDGTGAIISRYASSAPGASGTHAAGDRVIQSNPVVGNPKGWRCTVSGAPGTWVSEGNL